MKGETKRPEEPMGIVINGGARPEEGTVFVAYVWGPAPAAPTREKPKAA